MKPGDLVRFKLPYMTRHRNGGLETIDGLGVIINNVSTQPDNEYYLRYEILIEGKINWAYDHELEVISESS